VSAGGDAAVEKVWLAHYPPGVPAEIDMGAFASLKHVIEQSCARFAERPAYTNMGRTLSYAEVETQSARFGAYLQKACGLQKGERVAVMLPNLLQYPIAVFGILRAGLSRREREPAVHAARARAAARRLGRARHRDPGELRRDARIRHTARTGTQRHHDAGR
jgi:non-ribosomal peptide synthetase component E (peptide arylation enzyme)